MATQAQIAAVQQLYIGYLGRAADKAGLDFWTNAVSTGVSTLASVATGFTLSTEYKAAFGGLTNDALVEKVYTSVLGRASDTAGKAFWVDALAKGTVTSDKLVATFIGALSAPDQTIINNKTFVAQTYTDTVGANYNTAAGAAVIVGVNGTTASVNTALANITNGTLTGLVPGAALINAVAAANADKAAYGVATAATNPTFDTLKADGTVGKDGVVDSVDAAAAALAAGNARAVASGDTTVKITSDLSAATTAATSAKLLAQAQGSSTQVAAYDAAVLAQKALVGTAVGTPAIIGTGTADAPQVAAKSAYEVAKATAQVTETAALAAADAALNANVGVTTAVSYASLFSKYNTAAGTDGTKLTGTLDVAGLKNVLDTAPTGTGATDAIKAANLAANTAAKTALLTELAKLPTYGQPAVDSAAKVAAFTTAENNVSTTGSAVSDYSGKAHAQAVLTDKLAVVTVADAAVAAAKVVVDKYSALDSSIQIAKASLSTFASANADKVTITDVSKVAVTTQATAKADVFYFGDSKAVAVNDFSIGGTTNFGAGDSIVLGTGYTFNSGALSTGNANTLEFFLVKGATGTQVVIETEAYGNSSTTVDTAGNVIASPNATVINLVGVTADHLAVNNGVVSYV